MDIPLAFLTNKVEKATPTNPAQSGICGGELFLPVS